MCLMCSKGPYKWFEYFAKNPITTWTVLKKGGILEVQDMTKKENKKNVEIFAVRKEDEYGGKIIELLTNSDWDYELLK